MIQNSCYLSANIDHHTYLLPFGQGIANHYHAIEINSTGQTIWKHLSKNLAKEELLQCLFKDFSLSNEEQTSLQEDILPFLDTLLKEHILLENPLPKFSTDQTDCFNWDSYTQELPFSCSCNIGGIQLLLSATSVEIINAFMPFSKNAASFDCKIKIMEESMPAPSGGSYLLRHPQLCVYEKADAFFLFFPSSDGIYGFVLSKDGKNGILFCENCNDSQVSYFAFHAIRHAYLYLAGLKSMYAIHSASILYKGKAWLFCGPSGTGKSTHAALWHTYLNCPYINGDLNLLANEDGKWVVHGLPWCGTSNIYDVNSYPLGGIIHLKQAADDSVSTFSFDKTTLMTLQRLISPLWNSQMLKNALSVTSQLCMDIPILQLHCTKDRHVLEVIREYIDKYIINEDKTEK